MRVSECMHTDVRIIDPQCSLRDAALTMAEIDAGFLPVAEGDRLVGIVTDRDIALRGVGQSRSPEDPIDSVMSQEVCYCFEDEDVDQVLDNMGAIQVRRLPVVSRDKRLVGVVSISDLAHEEGDKAGSAFDEITRPSSQHSQVMA